MRFVLILMGAANVFMVFVNLAAGSLLMAGLAAAGAVIAVGTALVTR